MASGPRRHDVPSCREPGRYDRALVGSPYDNAHSNRRRLTVSGVRGSCVSLCRAVRQKSPAKETSELNLFFGSNAAPLQVLVSADGAGLGPLDPPLVGRWRRAVSLRLHRLAPGRDGLGLRRPAIAGKRGEIGVHIVQVARADQGTAAVRRQVVARRSKDGSGVGVTVVLRRPAQGVGRQKRSLRLKSAVVSVLEATTRRSGAEGRVVSDGDVVRTSEEVSSRSRPPPKPWLLFEPTELYATVSLVIDRVASVSSRPPPKPVA